MKRIIFFLITVIIFCSYLDSLAEDASKLGDMKSILRLEENVEKIEQATLNCLECNIDVITKFGFEFLWNKNRKVISFLIEKLKEDGIRARRGKEIITTLGIIGDEEVIPILLQELKGELKPAWSFWAAEAIGNMARDKGIKDKSVTAALIERLKIDKDWNVRSAAAEALGKISDSEATEALTEASVKDGVEMVKSRAAEALAVIKSPELYNTYYPLPCPIGVAQRRDAKNHIILGWEYFSKKREYQKAFEEFQKAIEIEPDNIDLSYSLASFYYRYLCYEKAIEICKNILGRINYADILRIENTGRPKAYDLYNILFLLGDVYEKMGNYQESIMQFKKMLKIKPKFEAENKYIDKKLPLELQQISRNQYQRLKENLLRQRRTHGRLAELYEKIGKEWASRKEWQKAVENSDGVGLYLWKKSLKETLLFVIITLSMIFIPSMLNLFRLKRGSALFTIKDLFWEKHVLGFIILLPLIIWIFLGYGKKDIFPPPTIATFIMFTYFIGFLIYRGTPKRDFFISFLLMLLGSIIVVLIRPVCPFSSFDLAGIPWLFIIVPGLTFLIGIICAVAGGWVEKNNITIAGLIGFLIWFSPLLYWYFLIFFPTVCSGEYYREVIGEFIEPRTLPAEMLCMGYLGMIAGFIGGFIGKKFSRAI